MGNNNTHIKKLVVRNEETPGTLEIYNKLILFILVLVVF